MNWREAEAFSNFARGNASCVEWLAIRCTVASEEAVRTNVTTPFIFSNLGQAMMMMMMTMMMSSAVRTFEVEGDSESLGAGAQSFVIKLQG